MAEVTFADWTERLKVYNDYIKALGEYKLRQAEIEIKKAEAANAWETVKLKRIVIRQLQRELAEFNRQQKALQTEIARVKKRDKAALMLLKGRRIQPATYTTAWGAYGWFESETLTVSGNNLHKIEVPAIARTADNFVSVRTTAKPEPAPDDVDNVLELMHWMNEKRFIAKAGSSAQGAVVELYQKINGVATATVAELRTQLQSIKDGTHGAWNLNAILGVPANATGKKIEKAGTQ